MGMFFYLSIPKYVCNMSINWTLPRQEFTLNNRTTTGDNCVIGKGIRFTVIDSHYLNYLHRFYCLTVFSGNKQQMIGMQKLSFSKKVLNNIRTEDLHSYIVGDYLESNFK